VHDFLNLSIEKKEELKSSDNDVSDNITGEVSKRLKMDHEAVAMEVEPDTGVVGEETLSKSETAWRLLFP